MQQIGAECIKIDIDMHSKSHKSELNSKCHKSEFKCIKIDIEIHSKCHKSELSVLKIDIKKKGKRKAQGVPQSQTAALPRHQEEEETDKFKQAQIEQTYDKHQD